MKRSVLGLFVVYLLAGLLFAASTMPEQSWACPDPTAPHGYVTYGGVAGPPREGCRATVSTGERARWLALGSTAWLPLVVAKGMSNVTEP